MGDNGEHADEGAGAGAGAGGMAQKAPATEATSQPAKHALRPFIIISTSYLLFTVTDGAIRMIVLMHAYNLRFTAMEVALMFTLYEVAGVVTNLLAGVAGSRFGIRATLLSGLVLQLAGIGMLFGWNENWTKSQGIVYVIFAQALSGIAKDLTKLGGKTVTKLVTPDEKQSYLFKLVSFITGFKNSLKGVGYFVGAVSLAWNYYFALGLLMVLIVLAMPWAALGLNATLGRSVGKSVTLRDVFQMNYNVNVLSVARIFLFGSRDAWFEVPLPFFLRDMAVGLGWSPQVTGLFLAGFIIVYGQVQSWSPQLVLSPLGQAPANKFVGVLWAGALFLLPTAMGPIVLTTDFFSEQNKTAMSAILLTGIAIFCVLFAINSSVHSYLILRYADGNKVAVNVGFYYMSNAIGRLVGTILSGVLYSYAGPTRAAGFGWCFVLAAGFLAICVCSTMYIRDDEDGLMCGRLAIISPLSAKAAPTDDKDVENGTDIEACGHPEPVDVQPPATEASPLHSGSNSGQLVQNHT